MKIMVSACLLGQKCKYNGGDNYDERTAAAFRGHELVPVCPEVAGGLTVPRRPCEIAGGVVVNDCGENVDEAFRKGAAEALETALREQPDIIILQSRSPSCGVKQIYDGTFSGKLVPGMGVFAEMAKKAGFRVVDVEDVLKEETSL